MEHLVRDHRQCCFRRNMFAPGIGLLVRYLANPERPPEKMFHFRQRFLLKMVIVGVWKKSSRVVVFKCKYNYVRTQFPLTCFEITTFNIEIMQDVFFKIRYSKHFTQNRTKILVFFIFVFFKLFCIFFWLTSKQISLFHFFGKPYFALKINTKSITFTKNILKMIVIYSVFSLFYFVFQKKSCGSLLKSEYS